MVDAYLLIAINVAVYLGLTAAAGKPALLLPPELLLRAGGNYVPLVRAGQAWRLWSAGFMHASVLHLGLNLFGLYWVWRRVAPELGPGMLVVYGASLLGGSLASAGFRWRAPVPSDEEIKRVDRSIWQDLWFETYRLKVSVGASGAICGLMGAGVVAGLLRHDAEGTKLATDAATWAAYTLVYGLEGNVDNAAHTGGLLAGAACAAALGLHPQLDAAVWQGAVLLATAGAFALAWRRRATAETVVAMVNRGAVLANAGDFAGARVLYERALAMHPWHALAHANLARSLLHAGALDAAEREARTALAQEPGLGFAARALRDIEAKR
jgi:rhomboid protease GluP